MIKIKKLPKMYNKDTKFNVRAWFFLYFTCYIHVSYFRIRYFLLYDIIITAWPQRKHRETVYNHRVWSFSVCPAPPVNDLI